MSWGRELVSWKRAPSVEKAFFNMSLQREKKHTHTQTIAMLLKTKVTRVPKKRVGTIFTYTYSHLTQTYFESDQSCIWPFLWTESVYLFQ